MSNRSLNYKYWEYSLGRNLRKKEVQIIRNARFEVKMNGMIDDINNHVKSKGLCIPILTVDDGNCLFHSLYYHLYPNSKRDLKGSIDSFKQTICKMLLFYKTMENFVPDQEMSLEKLFPFHNEIENVYCYANKKVYKYNYDAMCIDLISNNGWKRINTELLLTTLSIGLNIKFKIYHSNEHVTIICPLEKENTKTIFLTQLGECHYIPLDIINPDVPYECPYYYDDIKKFESWADEIEADYKSPDSPNYFQPLDDDFGQDEKN